MDALDLGCFEGPYASRGQLLKGSTPQGVKLIEEIFFMVNVHTQRHTAIEAIVAIATLCRTIRLALPGNFKISGAHLQGNFKTSRL
jgi:hypothetical protein